MATYRALVDWSLPEGQDFLGGRYSRAHTITFDEGLELPGSASAHVIGNKWAVARAADPEEMLVASISTCHMLTFLHKAREAGWLVTAYRDEAEGVMEAIAPERLAVTRVTLRPTIAFADPAPDAAARAALHHAAHEECFIANSVKTEVRVEER